MTQKLLFQKMEKIEQLLLAQNSLQKDILTFNEAAAYLDVSHSHLYKLTSTAAIPVYKPNGKKLYFKKNELDEWIVNAKQESVNEIGNNIGKMFLNTERRFK